jgi:hypothetical protein
MSASCLRDDSSWQLEVICEARAGSRLAARSADDGNIVAHGDATQLTPSLAV